MRVRTVTLIFNEGEIDQLSYEVTVDAAEHPEASDEQALNEGISQARYLLDQLMPISGQRRQEVLDRRIEDAPPAD